MRERGLLSTVTATALGVTTSWAFGWCCFLDGFLIYNITLFFGEEKK